MSTLRQDGLVKVKSGITFLRNFESCNVTDKLLLGNMR